MWELLLLYICLQRGMRKKIYRDKFWTCKLESMLKYKVSNLEVRKNLNYTAIILD